MTKDCVLMKHHDNITRANFKITSTKPCAPVANLSIKDNIKLLEKLKQGLKRTISWNKHRSEITTQPKNSNLDYMVDPTFTNINRPLCKMA